MIADAMKQAEWKFYRGLSGFTQSEFLKAVRQASRKERIYKESDWSGFMLN